jgi:hypothetical protein
MLARRRRTPALLRQGALGPRPQWPVSIGMMGRWRDPLRHRGVRPLACDDSMDGARSGKAVEVMWCGYDRRSSGWRPFFCC